MGTTTAPGVVLLAALSCFPFEFARPARHGRHEHYCHHRSRRATRRLGAPLLLWVDSLGNFWRASVSARALWSEFRIVFSQAADLDDAVVFMV